VARYLETMKSVCVRVAEGRGEAPQHSEHSEHSRNGAQLQRQIS
jgi:hypothetical protein